MNDLSTGAAEQALAPTTTDKMDLSAQTMAVGGGFQLIPQSLAESVEFARLMSKADSVVPKHCREKPGTCLAIAMQAWRWDFDPFIVAQKSYVVNDIVAYEAQLIAAVVNTRAGLRDRPQIEFEGEGDCRRCIVTFVFRSGAIRTYTSPEFQDIYPKNSPLWKNDPDQQLGYYSIRACARRHCPEVILGAYDRDELQDIDVTPVKPAMGQRLSETQDQPTEGFGATDVDQETLALTEGVGPEIQPDVTEAETVPQTGPLPEPEIPDSLKRADEPPAEPEAPTPTDDDTFPGDREFDPERDEDWQGEKA